MIKKMFKESITKIKSNFLIYKLQTFSRFTGLGF